MKFTFATCFSLGGLKCKFHPPKVWFASYGGHCLYSSVGKIRGDLPKCKLHFGSPPPASFGSPYQKLNTISPVQCWQFGSKFSPYNK